MYACKYTQQKTVGRLLLEFVAGRHPRTLLGSLSGVSDQPPRCVPLLPPAAKRKGVCSSPNAGSRFFMYVLYICLYIHSTELCCCATAAAAAAAGAAAPATTRYLAKQSVLPARKSMQGGC
jgi:hypothetical protein